MRYYVHVKGEKGGRGGRGDGRREKTSVSAVWCDVCFPSCFEQIATQIIMTEHGEETPLLLDGGDGLLRELDDDNEKNDVVEDVIDTLQLAAPIFISRVSFTGVSDM